MHPSHYRSDLTPIADPLYVVTMIANPLRFRSRYWNFHLFEREVAAAGAVLYTAEVAYGDRPFELTEAGRPDHLQLRTRDEVWHKENALNLLIQRLPADARYVAWIDADVQFTRPDWAQETIQHLQHYQVIQMFSQAQDMGPEYASQGAPAQGFAACYVDGVPQLRTPGPLGPYGARDTRGGVYWHPGYGWAARREALDALGGLLDFAILGSADWHMAMALVGRAETTITARYTDTYKSWVREWERRAERHVRRDVGYLPGLILHHYHGSKANRGYETRHTMLDSFDPSRDIKRDSQGLWTLDPDNITLRDALRRYNRSRREDS